MSHDISRDNVRKMRGRRVGGERDGCAYDVTDALSERVGNGTRQREWSRWVLSKGHKLIN